MAGTETNNVSSLRFTPEQVQRILSLIESPKPTHEKLSGKHSWLFDSGALYHMIGNLSLLTNVVNIDPIPVSKANGSITYAAKRGSVVLNSTLILQDVIYVPNLDCNLISAGPLVDEIYCMVTFFKKRCVVQYLTSKKLIGVDELHRGVFAFK